VHIAEHHADGAVEIREQLDRLSVTAVDAAAWDTQFNRLVDLVSHHVKEEEGEYFPAGQRAFGDRVNEMLSAYQQTYELTLEQLTLNAKH